MAEPLCPWLNATACILLLSLTACSPSLVPQRLPREVRAAQTEKFHQEILDVAVEGDWLVTQGYHASDVLVTAATGIPPSHAGVYDAERGEVMEAEGEGVHASALKAFVDKSHRILVIRPRWSTPDNRHDAVLRARALVGKNYDTLGTIGFDSPSRYYCSELAVAIYRERRAPDERLPRVITPGELYLWGKVLYDSLPRTDQREEGNVE